MVINQKKLQSICFRDCQKFIDWYYLLHTNSWALLYHIYYGLYICHTSAKVWGYYHMPLIWLDFFKDIHTKSTTLFLWAFDFFDLVVRFSPYMILKNAMNWMGSPEFNISKSLPLLKSLKVRHMQRNLYKISCIISWMLSQAFYHI